MIVAKEHVLESERFSALESYSILDTSPEEDFDNITKLAAEICGTPICLISLVGSDRQWFKSHHGLRINGTPREFSFCGHAINHEADIFIVHDARKDSRFFDNPLVTKSPNIVFYAGVTLVDEEGLPLGTLCVMDNKPHRLTEDQQNFLTIFSSQVMNLLELRKKRLELEEVNETLQAKNKELEQFAYAVAHDIRSPLKRISSLAQLISNSTLSGEEEVKPLLDAIDSSSEKLNTFVEGVLNYSKTEHIGNEGKSVIYCKELKNEILNHFNPDSSVNILCNYNVDVLVVNKSALQQILINLVGNAIKYGYKEYTEVILSIREDNSYYHFTVSDNGRGIPEEFQSEMFEIFKILGVEDRYGKKGNGIGLATVKRLIEQEKGKISVESSRAEGTTFSFTIKK
ncbi:MAG: GAF domain-containing sensor histidine kinase [Cyclobacteriaceae bacterium]|nr:GAF domain-containing sensor histidine kinase [Cyclobacteriaceae bacterium]